MPATEYESDGWGRRIDGIERPWRLQFDLRSS
jgi:hypothetical protein